MRRHQAGVYFPLTDLTICSFYLMDPDGQFVDAFGRSASQEEVTGKVNNYMKEYKAGVKRTNA